jgi:urease accessory protein
MNRQSAGLGLLLVALSATNASAHHVMGGRMPATFMDGLLSGLGHPIIGIDHFAAVVAVGCLAATHKAAPTLVIGFIAAMMAGVALHLHGASLPAAQLLVAITVIALGAVLVGNRRWRRLPCLRFLLWSDSCTATRSGSRYMVPSQRRFTPT